MIFLPGLLHVIFHKQYQKFVSVYFIAAFCPADLLHTLGNHFQNTVSHLYPIALIHFLKIIHADAKQRSPSSFLPDFLIIQLKLTFRKQSRHIICLALASDFRNSSHQHPAHFPGILNYHTAAADPDQAPLPVHPSVFHIMFRPAHIFQTVQIFR